MLDEMNAFSVEELPDGELTDPEVRRLIYEVVRERFRVVSDAHLSEWWEAKRQYEQNQRRVRSTKGSDGSETRDRPFPDYDPSELQPVYDALLARARIEVLAIRKLNLDDGDGAGAVSETGEIGT